MFWLRIAVFLFLGFSLLASAGATTVYAQNPENPNSQSISGIFRCGAGRVRGDSDEGNAGRCGLADYIAEPSGFVYQSWQSARIIINVLLVIALLVIAFSNITRINIDNYTLKKSLPNLILGIILANASFLIVRWLADIATVISYLFVELSLGENFSFADFISAAIAQLTESTILTVGGGISVVLLIPAVIAAIILMLWLAFLLYFRLVAVYLLTILAPLAFVAYGIPGQEKYFKMWWQHMIKWMFLLPAMSAVFWLMIVIGRSSDSQSIARLLIMYVLFFIAVTIPTRFGGSVMDRASGLFKKAATSAHGSSQALGLQASLWGRNLAGSERAGGVLKFLGKGLQYSGHAIASPTALKQGLKQRMEGAAKGREFEMRQGWVYRRAAGGQARFMDKYSKSMDDLRGMDAESLAREITGYDPKTNTNKNQELLDWYEGLDPADQYKLLTTPFSAWSIASKKSMPRNEEEVAGFIAALKLFNTESRRRTQRVGGVNDFMNSGWDFEELKRRQQEPRGGGAPYGDSASPINAAIANEIEQRLKQGHLAEEISNDIAAKHGLDRADALGAVKDIEAILRIRPLIEHFKDNAGAQSIAKLGAQLGEEFEEAFAHNTELAFDQVIAKGKKFLQDSGASIGYSADIPGKTKSDQAAELQRRVSEVSRAAHSAALGHSAETVTKIAGFFEQTGAQLESLTQGADPVAAAAVINNNEQAQQIINNHVINQAQAQNVSLSPNQLQQIAQTLKTDLVQELGNNKTLSRIFGSEKFRQKLAEAIHSTQPIEVIAPQGNQENDTN